MGVMTWDTEVVLFLAAPVLFVRLVSLDEALEFKAFWLVVIQLFLDIHGKTISVFMELSSTAGSSFKLSSIYWSTWDDVPDDRLSTAEAVIKTAIRTNNMVAPMTTADTLSISITCVFTSDGSI